MISSNATLKVLGVISIIVYTRYLLKEELALVPIFAIMGRLSMVVFSFGILPTLVREIPSLLKEKKAVLIQSYISTSLIIIIPGIILFSILCYSFADFLSIYFFKKSDYASLLKLMSFGFFFAGINRCLSYIYWCLSRFKEDSKRIVIVGFIQIITGISFVMVWGIHGLIVSLIISNVINTSLYIFNLKDLIFASSFTLYSPKKLIFESVPFYLESYLMYFRAEGDQLLVGGLLGAEALAIYYIAKKPYEFLSSFTDSLDKVLTTSLARFKNDMNIFNEKLNSLITINSFILFPVVWLVIGITPTFILLIAGQGYEGAVIPAMIFLLYLVVQVSWRTTLGRSIFLLKPSIKRFQVTLVETMSVLGFMLILGYFYNIVGVVIGRFLATLVSAFWAYYLVKHDVSINIDLKNTVAIISHSIIMGLLLLLAQFFFTSYILLGLSLVCSVLVFLFLINITISHKFYNLLNTISPVKIIDPFSYLMNKGREFKA